MYGQWPESLDDIKSIAPANIFVDQFNNGSFAYKFTDDSFKLYSKGKNNIDDKGRRRRGGDDWPIWPPKTSGRREPDESVKEDEPNASN